MIKRADRTHVTLYVVYVYLSWIVSRFYVVIVYIYLNFKTLEILKSFDSSRKTCHKTISANIVLILNLLSLIDRCW